MGALFLCGSVAGCDERTLLEPTTDEYEVLLRTWGYAEGTAEFIKVLATKADANLLATREGTAGDLESFVKGVDNAYRVAEEIIDADRLFVFNGEIQKPFGEEVRAGAFYSTRPEGEVIAFNRDTFYHDGDQLYDILDPSTFLHEGAHRYNGHSDAMPDANRVGEVEQARVAIKENDFAYQLSGLGRIVSNAVHELHFPLMFFDRQAEHRGVGRMQLWVADIREEIEASRLDDFIDDRFEVDSRNSAVYGLYGVTVSRKPRCSFRLRRRVYGKSLERMLCLN